jgi:hypothetical protein
MMKLFEPLQQELKHALRDATRLRQDLDKARAEVQAREGAFAQAREASQAEKARLEQALVDARTEAARAEEALAREREKSLEAEARAVGAAQMDEKLAAVQEVLVQKLVSAQSGFDEKLATALSRGPSRTIVSGPRVDVSGFGGMWLFQSFLRRLRLRDLLVEHVRVNPDPVDYSASETILALVCAVAAGLRRIDKTELAHQSGAFLDLLEIDRFPDAPAIRRFLARLNAPETDALAALHDSLRAHLGALPQKRRELVLDVDACISAVSGKTKDGKPIGRAYHPLYAFEQSFQEFWHGVLRPGKALPAAGVIPFLQECLAKIPAGMTRSRVRFRLDGRFCDRRVVELLDRSRCGFVLPARDNPALRERAAKLRFKRLANGWNAGEFKGKVEAASPRASRFVVIRRPAGEGAHLELAPLFRKDKHAYYVFVTNQKTSPFAVYDFYRGRAAVEKNARELLEAYPLGQIPPGRWSSNDAFFRILLLAADLQNWFKRLCLPREYLGESLGRVRSDYLLMPAQLVQQGGQNLFFLPRDYHAREEFLKAARAIAQLKLPARFTLVRKPVAAARAATGAGKGNANAKPKARVAKPARRHAPAPKPAAPAP